VSVAFVFTNPGHHLAMMSPVERELSRRGVACRMISLAEFRGFDTPTGDPRLVRAIPFNPRRKRARAGGAGAPGAHAEADAAPSLATRLRRVELARFAVWQVLRLRMRQLLRGARVVVIPNDMVYPYRQLAEDVHARGGAIVLMQEGIRFPLPNGYTGPVYGGSGAAAICAWGEGSRDYFALSRVPAHSIVVTGSPRLDGLDLAHWRERGRELLAAHELASPPIAFLSNPIEIQNYGDKAMKLDLFARFLAGAAPIVRPSRTPIVVKLHMHEDPADFARVAAASPIADLVTVLAGEPIFAVLGAARAGVVLTSTVGLEALMFGVPLGQLEIPGHPFAFEYVSRGAATPLRLASLGADLEALLADPPARRAAGAAFVERHLHDLGHAAGNVAGAIERVLRAS
jgi:hypothetical protein